MKTYKNMYGGSWLYPPRNNKIGHNIAHTLYDFGVKSVKPCVHFIAGHEDTEHLDIWMTSFTCEPYIKVLVGKKERPLLWAIMDELNISFSGCSSEDEGYMQASFTDSHLLGWRVKRLSATELISSVCLYFEAIKEFKNAR